MKDKIIKSFEFSPNGQLDYQNMLDIIFKEEKPDFKEVKELRVTLKEMVDKGELKRFNHTGDNLNPTYEIASKNESTVLSYKDFCKTWK